MDENSSLATLAVLIGGLVAASVSIRAVLHHLRITDVVGEPAMRYLTRWRLQLARMALRECDNPLGIVAERFGYRSEAAFCRAFKREFGVSPGSDRRVGPAPLLSA